MSDLKAFQYTLEQCNHCGQCEWLLPARATGRDFAVVCPIYDHFHFDAYSGQGILNIAREVLEGRLTQNAEIAGLLHRCTGCGACDVNCKSVRDMEVLGAILELRRDSAEAGFLPEAKKALGDRVEATHNLYGLPHGERFSWLPEGFSDDPDSDTALFVGCSVYKRPETALAAIRILKAGGVKFRLLYEEEWCCGGALWRSGQHERAQALMRRNAETFRRLGIRRIITACAECFGAFRSGYPRFVETDFETVHITQIASQLLREGKLALRGDAPEITLTYHDPCMLGRLSEPYVPWAGEIRSYGLHVPEKQWNRGEHGVYEPPRELLRAIPGLSLREMPRSMEEAWCCGAQSQDPELAAFAAAERKREAASTGAEAVVSACPFCREALAPDEASAMPYFDLTELLAEQLDA